MSMLTLEATTRAERGRKTFGLRAEGQVPAVVYGGAIPAPLHVTINRNAFVRVFKAAGESTLIELAIDGKPLSVLIHDMQLDPLRDEVIHADFRAVDMLKPIEAKVKLIFVGESPAVKGLGGILVKSMHEVTIKALPKDLVSVIEVDLATLKTFDDVISVKHLATSTAFTIVEDGQQMVATVMAPRSEAEMAALDTALELDVTKVEVAEKGKEKVEGEEGEAAPADAKADASAKGGSASGGKKPEAKKEVKK